jgi:hypothetical protein
VQLSQARNAACAAGVLLLIGLLAPSCAPQLRTNIAVYHSLPDRPEGALYAFAPITDQRSVLDNTDYRRSIKDELLHHGYREAPLDEVSLVVAFSHSMDHDQAGAPLGREGGEGRDAYSRKLWVYVMDKRSLSGDALRVLYEGNIISFGTSEQLRKAMPFMIRALLQDFPGANGTLRTEYITLD